MLVVDDLRFAGRRAPVGLFVGDGSRGYFRDVVIALYIRRRRGRPNWTPMRFMIAMASSIEMLSGRTRSAANT